MYRPGYEKLTEEEKLANMKKQLEDTIAKIKYLEGYKKFLEEMIDEYKRSN